MRGLALLVLAGCTSSASAAFDDGAEALARTLDAHPELLEVVGSKGLRLLHLAAEKNDVVAARMLLSRGASVDARDAQGRTALCVAARYDALEVASVLLDHRSNPGEACDSMENRALHYAARYAGPSLTRRILAAGAGVDQGNRWSATPLHAAALNGDRRAEASAAVLIGAHASLEVVDFRGFTPLHTAAVRDTAALVDLLLAAGASTTARAPTGETAYELALSRHADSAATRLSEAEPELTREPPLFLAARTDDLPRLLELLPYVRREVMVGGLTAKQVAERSDSRQCAAVLSEHVVPAKLP